MYRLTNTFYVFRAKISVKKFENIALHLQLLTMKIIFAGTPPFAASALDALIKAGHEICLVLSQPDRPSGRGMKLTPSAVKALALEHNIPVETPLTLSLKKGGEEAQKYHDQLKAQNADIMVVAAYGMILPQAVLDIPKGIGPNSEIKCINIHASLLPRWRGAAPITRAIESAQRKVETRNFDIRKNLIEYDDVANEQRKVIYEERNSLLDGQDISDTIHNIFEDVLDSTVSEFITPNSLAETWDTEGLTNKLKSVFDIDAPVAKWLEEDEKLVENDVRERIIALGHELYKAKCQTIGEENQKNLEKQIMLQCIDTLWKEHLAAMDYMRQGIGLQGYAQKNPKNEYKIQSFNLFTKMLDNLKLQVVSILCRIQVRVRTPEEIEQVKQAQEQQALEQKMRDEAKQYANMHIGRNDPCPCGSGKKFKVCHGRFI